MNSLKKVSSENNKYQNPEVTLLRLYPSHACTKYYMSHVHEKRLELKKNVPLCIGMSVH
jgi:hypothetical protein